MTMNVLVLGSGDGDADAVVAVTNAKSERHALACAMAQRCGGTDNLNMALVLSYCSVTDRPATEVTDGANKCEPPGDDGEDWVT